MELDLKINVQTDLQFQLLVDFYLHISLKQPLEGKFKIRTYLLCILLLHIKPPAAFSEFYLRGCRNGIAPYFQQLISTEKLPTVSNRTFWQNRSDKMMSHCCFQTYPQPTVLTELAHMGHLKGKKWSCFQYFFICFFFPHLYILCSPPKKSTFSQKLQKSYCGVAKLWSFACERVLITYQFHEPTQMQRKEPGASTRDTVQGSTYRHQ